MSLLQIFTLCLMLTLALADKCPRPEEIAPCQCRTRGPTIQVRCTNSMMGRITEAMTMLRRRVTEVDVLILEDNNIPHLPSRAFGSVKINRLFIENNRMMTIDRNAFAGIEDFLTELYIKESNLKSLPKDSIDFLHHLTVFSVENSQIMTMPKVVGLKKLKLFKIDGSNIRDVPARTLSDLPALRYLHICRSSLTRMDIGVLEDLRHLILANFTDNQMSWIHPRAFRYMEQLEEVVLKGNKFRDASIIGRAMRVVKPLKKLDISHNELEDLQEDSFVDVINLEALTLSHNNLTDLRRGAVHRMPRLKSVDLSHNRIRNFHSDSFMNTPLIDELKLDHNRLTEVSDVSFVMDALPKLRILDLSNNDIRGIPFGALRGYPALERLFLASNQISRMSLQALADMPSLMELDLSDNKLIADAIEGPIFDLPNLRILNLSKNKLAMLDDQLLTTLNRLKRLDVSHNGIASISESAFKGVRQLDYLNISYNNLREFKPKTFKGLKSLYELDASHNELVALPDDLLLDQRNLEYISFAFNHIQLVSMHLFPANNRIRHLDFTSNFIMAFPEKLINGLPSLEKLLFRRNSLQKLSRRSFRGLKSLEVLDLHDNRIQDIDDRAFEDLQTLKGLDLSLNIISSVGDSLEPLTNLMKLNLSDNYITSLPRNAFHSLERLSTLDVSNNTIVEIGTAFTSMPALKYLDLSYNHLPMIKKGAFKDLPTLVGLRLDYNSIIELQPEAFQDLWNLETLILTKNGIPKIQADTFRNLPSLEKLKMDDNLIESLERSAFSDLFSLKELHLQQNIIQFMDENTFLRVPSIRHLNMSYNLLKDLPRSGFYGLDTLETLDLSFNDLRSVDSSLFDNMNWLVDLRLNDNNICRINRYAFRDTTSLRSLSLKNNRLTRLAQDALGGLERHIRKFDIAGNPLTCDCETLWLRNWASSERSAVEDEPICYFPSQLSGNPLRQLRTSRFTCGARSTQMIRDACRGIPVKTPAQQHIQVGLKSGIFDTEMVTEALNSGHDEAAYEVKTAPEDEDSVDVDTDNEIGTNPEYEYYYVYYDEEGNVVEKSPPKVIESAVLNGNKVQDIPLVSSTTTSTTTKNTAALNTNQLGDTPTIYASLGETSDSQESGEKSEETENEGDDGMSIFGIPIPKIPFPILSFGLAPTTLSHGLLPIGRKGDPGSSESDSSEAGLNRKTANQPEITRGPDTIDPIWLETLINAGKSYFAGGSAEEDDDNEEELLDTEIDRNFQQYFPNLKGYSQPENPVIPLTSSEEQQDYQDIPIIITNSGPEYYPQASQYVPAIKFDHPTGNGGPVRYPIRPAPDLQPHQYPAGPAAEDGFIPLFLPDQSDPIRRSTTPPPAFPGIDSTLRLPAEGYKLPLYPQRQPALNFEYPLIYKKPPQQLPDSEIPIVYANNESPASIEVENSGELPQELPEYLAVPPEYEVPKKREYPIFKDKSTTELPIIKRSTKTPPTTSEAPPEYEYYYVYEDEPGTNPVQELFNNLGISTTSTTTTEKVVTTEETTTERKVPTLQVEEIIPTKTTTTSTTEVPSTTTTSTAKPVEVEYEYEYYYEYYEDPSAQNHTEVKEEQPPKVESTESSFSLKNFLNYITSSSNKDEIPNTTEVAVSNAGTTGMTIPKKPLLLPNGNKPTPPVPIRTSTELYDNYLESQRSTVTVETTNPRQHENHRRLPIGRSTTSAGTPASTPYPFRPDRLDPKGLQPHNNEVKWYYSNYNSEGLEPYIDPRVPREQDEAAHVQLSQAPSINLNVFTVLILPYLMLHF